jgi:hypothetical protein
MEWKDIGVFAGLTITLVLGLGNLIWIIVYGRRTTFINTVTSERVKWIGKLRENLSKYTGRTHSWLALRRSDSTRSEEFKSEIDVLRYEIKLQLNPGADPDKQIIQKINEIPDLASQSDINPALNAMNELIGLGQNLLSAEWKKVKREAQRGALADKLTFVERLRLFRPGTVALVPISLTVFGLILTVVGAGLTARGVVVSQATATELASTKWGMNEELRRSIIRQSRDARNGMVFVAVGAMLQIGGLLFQLSGTGKSDNTKS